MVAHYDAAHITLHVRKSNRAAISLYRDTLGFEVHGMEKSYCTSFNLPVALPGLIETRCRRRGRVRDALRVQEGKVMHYRFQHSYES
jgi:ribosomal protein S18 acetylase RimI-like enzyme